MRPSVLLVATIPAGRRSPWLGSKFLPSNPNLSKTGRHALKPRDATGRAIVANVRFPMGNYMDVIPWDWRKLVAQNAVAIGHVCVA